MVARVKIQSPPAVAIDWRYFWYCVRDTWAKRFDMKKALPGLANSTLDNVWHGRPVGLIPFLRICKRMKMDPFKFLVERRSEEHTSELQSLMRISYAVFCLKKNIQN